MLKSLRIEGYALIDSIEINWQPGMTALTGETGSGKSIVLGALGLVLGERADAQVIRSGASKCLVEAVFDADLTPWLEEHNLDAESELVVRREVTAKGRSRAFINDTPVAVGDLRSLGALLVDLHGQDDTRALAERERRLQVIDGFGGHQAELLGYTLALSEWQQRLEERRALDKAAESPSGDLDYLSYQCAEIEALHLEKSDAEAMQEEWTMLQHAAAIRADLLEAGEAFGSDRSEFDVVSALGTAAKALGRASQHHVAATPLLDRVESIRLEALDLQRELEAESERVQEDPERALHLQRWLDEYQRLLTKHRVSTVLELQAKHAEMNEAMAAIVHRKERMAIIQAELEQARVELERTGATLLAVRSETASRLVERVQGQLAQLKMHDAALRVEWKPAATPDSWGMHEVEWLFRAHPSAAFLPLTQVASGGERSRLMLAIKAVQAQHPSARTIILDEIDTGVSGHVAECMARLMGEMAGHQQVIAVTHLPQVAGRADHHLHVAKTGNSEGVRTEVKALSPRERVDEVAAMLSGERVTSAAREHAAELLKR